MRGQGEFNFMLFIESRIAKRHLDSAARIALLEALQDRGLIPLIRTARLYAYEQALFGDERAGELEQLVASWSDAEGDAAYTRGDVFCFEDFAHFIVFGEASDGEQDLRAGIIYNPETDEPARKLDAFCRNVQESLESATRSKVATPVKGVAAPVKGADKIAPVRSVEWRKRDGVDETLSQFAAPTNGGTTPQANARESGERSRATEILENAEARHYLQKLGEAHLNGRASDMLAGGNSSHDAAHESLIAQLAAAGLVRRELLISCRKDGRSLFRLPSPDALAIMTASNAVCSECGSAVADERAEELVTPTPVASSMLKDGAWLLSSLRAALIELGIPETQIATRAATADAEAQALVTACGENFLFVLRDGDFNATHARRALDTGAEVNASHLVVIATGKIQDESRARLRENARRRARNGGEMEVIMVESVEAATAELRPAIERVSQRALTRELYELDASLGFSAGHLIATRFRLMQKTGALKDLAASAAGAMAGSLREI